MQTRHLTRLWFGLGGACLGLPLLLGGTSLWPSALSNLRNPLYIFAGISLLFLLFPSVRARATHALRAPATALSERSGRLLSFALMAFFLAAYLVMAARDHAAFAIHALDYSLFDHLFPNTAAGQFMQSAALRLNFPECADCSFFGQHSMPILFALYPLHRLIDDPRLLLYLHPLILWSAALPLYALLRHTLEAPLHRVLLLFAFLASSATASILGYSFHPEVFYLPLGFALLHAIVQGRLATALCWSLAFLAIKEDAALYLAAFALGAGLSRRVRPWFAGVLLVLSGATFLLNAFWVIPSGWPAGALRLTTHSGYGSDLAGIAAGMAARWTEVLTELAGGGWVPLAATFLFLPLLRLWTLLPIVTLVLLHSTSQSAPMRGLLLYYSAPLLPFLFLGFIDVLRGARWPLLRRPIAPAGKTLLALFAAACAALTGGAFLRFRPAHPDHTHLSDLRTALNSPKTESPLISQSPPGPLTPENPRRQHLAPRPEDTQRPLCADGAIIPHLGYEHLRGLSLLGPPCLADDRYDYLLHPGLPLYPHTRADLEGWLTGLRQRPAYRERAFGGFLLFQRKP